MVYLPREALLVSISIAARQINAIRSTAESLVHFFIGKGSWVAPGNTSFRSQVCGFATPSSSRLFIEAELQETQHEKWTHGFAVQNC